MSIDMDFSHDYPGPNGQAKPKANRPARLGNLLRPVLGDARTDSYLKNKDHKRAIKENKRRNEDRAFNDIAPGILAKGEYDAARLDAHPTPPPALEHNVISHRGNRRARQIAKDTPVRRPSYENITASDNAYVDDIAMAAVLRAKSLINPDLLPTITDASAKPNTALTQDTVKLRMIIPPPPEARAAQRAARHSAEDNNADTELFEKVS